jgi:RNA polymerase sigma factor (sigma-70 family)
MPTHLDNEQSMVAAAQAGDSEALVTLLNQYSRRIYRLGVRITGNHHDAEDVLQEASLKAYAALAEFRENSRFYTWLVRIAVNVALGKLRKRALWKESSLDEPQESEDGSYIPLEIETWGDDPGEACLRSDLQQVLSEVIQKLDTKLHYHSRRSDGSRKDEELLKWLRSLSSLYVAPGPHAVWRLPPQNAQRHRMRAFVPRHIRDQFCQTKGLEIVTLAICSPS